MNMPGIFWSDHSPLSYELWFNVCQFGTIPDNSNMHSQPDTESGDKRELELVESENEQVDQDLDRTATVNINNYHGLSAKIILVYAVCSSAILCLALC